MKVPVDKAPKSYGSNFKPTQAASSVPYKTFGSDFKPTNKGLDYSRPSSSTSRSSTRSAPANRGGSTSGSGRTGSTSTYSNSHSGGGVGGAMPAAPKVPSIGDYLKGDTTYQDQVAQLRKAYLQYVASQNNDRSQYQNQYGLNVKSLGEDRTRGFSDLTDDYASRGLLNSGVYGKAYSDLQSDYDQRQTQLDTQRQGYLDDLTTNLSNFKGDQSTTMTSAKQEALARRLAAMGG